MAYSDGRWSICPPLLMILINDWTGLIFPTVHTFASLLATCRYLGTSSYSWDGGFPFSMSFFERSLSFDISHFTSQNECYIWEMELTCHIGDLNVGHMEQPMSRRPSPLHSRRCLCAGYKYVQAFRVCIVKPYSHFPTKALELVSGVSKTNKS